MSVFVSPGVYIREIDQSQVAPAVSTTTVGAVGFATSGPIATPTLITSVDELIRVFGPPNKSDIEAHQLVLGMTEFFNKGGRLAWIVRVQGASGDAAVTATIELLDEDDVVTTIISGFYTGSYWNGFKVRISTGTVSDTFKLEVLNANNIRLEQYDNLVMDGTSVPAGARYALNAVNYNKDTNPNGSRVITMSDEAGSTKIPVVGTSVLGDTVSGDDGVPNSLDDASDAIIGSISGDARTGLQVFRGDAIDVQIIAAPGAALGHRAIANEIADICTDRRDAIGVVDVGQGLSTSEAVDWVNGTGSFSSFEPLDSSYAAAYWSWIKARDGYNGMDRFLAPSGFVLGVMAYTDFQTFPWFAPAGTARGFINRALELEVNPDQGKRDLLYTNNINPIASVGGFGVFVDGQKTLQRTTSALDRINVRRMLIYVTRAIRRVLMSTNFEPNDPPTWRLIVGIIESALNPVMQNRGLTQFQVVCDGTTNTPDVIDRNECRAKVFLQPTRAAEILVVDFIIQRTGATFQESIA
jgi:hypothetical protein